MTFESFSRLTILHVVANKKNLVSSLLLSKNDFKMVFFWNLGMYIANIVVAQVRSNKTLRIKNSSLITTKVSLL
jgi:hypothetical protein